MFHVPSLTRFLTIALYNHRTAGAGGPVNGQQNGDTNGEHPGFHQDPNVLGDLAVSHAIRDGIPQLLAQIQQLSVMLNNDALPPAARRRTEVRYQELQVQLQQAQTISAALAMRPTLAAQAAQRQQQQQGVMDGTGGGGGTGADGPWMAMGGPGSGMVGMGPITGPGGHMPGGGGMGGGGPAPTRRGPGGMRGGRGRGSIGAVSGGVSLGIGPVGRPGRGQGNHDSACQRPPVNIKRRNKKRKNPAAVLEISGPDTERDAKMPRHRE